MWSSQRSAVLRWAFASSSSSVARPSGAPRRRRHARQSAEVHCGRGRRSGAVTPSVSGLCVRRYTGCESCESSRLLHVLVTRVCDVTRLLRQRGRPFPAAGIQSTRPPPRVLIRSLQRHMTLILTAGPALLRFSGVIMLGCGGRSRRPAAAEPPLTPRGSSLVQRLNGCVSGVPRWLFR